VAVAVRIGTGRARDTALVEVPDDTGDAVSGQALPEHPVLARVADSGFVVRGSFFQRDFIRKE
jgi:hypothetical protein